jgi:hypothetical protein
MNDNWIAWAGFDEPATGAVSRLRVVSTTNLAAPLTLIDQPIADGLLWFPALNGDELWYAVINADFDGTGGGDTFHLETRTVTDPSAPPTIFQGTGKDFNPAVNDAFVVWKSAEGDSAALNWGTLHVLDRRTGGARTIPVSNANRPSIGDRYITFDEIAHSRLLVFDPEGAGLIDLGGQTGQGTTSFGGQSISGSLLAFYSQEEGLPPRIGWVLLPQ